MSEIHYRIVLDGTPLPDVAPETLHSNLAQLFKISPEKAQKMLGRTGMVVKRGLTENEAGRYLRALQKAGAVARKEVESASTSTQAKPPASPKKTVIEPKPSPLRKAVVTESAPRNPYAPPDAPVRDQENEEFGLLNPYSIHGRIGRLRYLVWAAMALLSIVVPFSVVIAIIIPMIAKGDSSTAVAAMVVLGTLAFVLLSYFMICITAKRLHDIGLSAWLALLNFIPMVNSIFGLVLMIIPGKKELNQYGQPPPPNSTAVHSIAAILIIVPCLGLLGILLAFIVSPPI